MIYLIYFLKHPIDGSVKYIGMTTDIKKRMKQHSMSKTNEHLYSWIIELKKDSLEPEIEIVSRATTLKKAKEIERQFTLDYVKTSNLFNRYNIKVSLYKSHKMKGIVKKLLDISEPAIIIITKIANEEGISFKAKAQQVIEKYAKNQ